jgi:DNA repair protein SbcC/Rad50
VITTVVVSGFRGVPQRREFPFAPITLLAGRNGLGKTTVFDAIDWCLFGSHWRLGYQPEAIRNLYNPSCAPSVSITLKLNGRNVTIDRTLEGVALDGDTLSDKDLIAELVTDTDVFGSYTRDMPERVRQMVYLPQAEIRAIVNPQNKEERQALFQSLLGVPNAAVLQASLRKVRERFATRRRRLEEQHSDLKEQIKTLSDAIRTAEPAAENDKRALFARIFRISKLRPQNAQASQTEELLSLARARLHELLDRRVQLEGFQAFRRQAEADLKLTRDEIVDAEEAIDKLIKEIADADKALEEANQHRDRGAKALRLAEQNLSQTSAKIDELMGLQLRAKELDGARRLMGEEQKSVLVFEPLVESATQNVALARQALEVARTSANQERDSLSDVRAQMARFQDLQQLRSTRNSVLQKLSSCDERIRELTTKVGDLGEQITVARLRFEQLEVNHRAAASRAADRDRLASLVTQVTGLVNDLQMSSCPVCGHEYGSIAELSDHIVNAGAQREEGDLELKRLTESVEESRSALSELEEQVAGNERDLRSETESRERFQGELADLSDTESVLIAEPSRAFLPAEIEGLEQQLRQAEERLEQVEASLSDAESSLETTDAELLRARERFTTAKSRFERLSFEPPESSDGELEHTEQTKATEEIQKADAEKAYQDQANVCEQLSSQTNSLRTSVQQHRARLAQSTQRLASLEAEVREQAERIGLAVHRAQVTTGVSDVINQLAQEEGQLREATDDLEKIVSADRYNVQALELKELENTRSTLQTQLDQITLAQARFNELAGLVDERSNAEARNSTQHLREAIQESFAALYPHNHLDQIELSTSDVLLYDSDLTSPVQPYFYTSTGQLNVLALSMFMGVALRQRICRLGFIMLDEPVQNLSDVQFLAFIMFVKRIALKRQVILSTADSNIAELFRRQMVSGGWSNGEPRYAQFEWRSFDPFTGPNFVPIDFPGVSRTRSADTSASA